MSQMRRKDRELKELAEIEEIIRNAQVCHVAMADSDNPYVLPFNFGYKDKTIYIHCAREGTKLDILRKNPKVCVVIDIDHELVEGEKAENFSWKYRSVVGFGTAEIIEGDEIQAKSEALDILMLQYTDKKFDCPEKVILKTTIIKITLDSMTGKSHGYKDKDKS